MSDQQDVVVIGSSGHAKVIADVIEKEGKYRIAGLIDTHKRVGEAVYGYGILGTEESHLPTLVANGTVFGGVIAIGDNWARSVMAEKINSLVPGFPFITVIHPSAVIAPSVAIGAGAFIAAGVVVNVDARIGEDAILNTGCTVDHDCVVGDHALVGPTASLCGESQIGTGLPDSNCAGCCYPGHLLFCYGIPFGGGWPCLLGWEPGPSPADVRSHCPCKSAEVEPAKFLHSKAGVYNLFRFGQVPLARPQERAMGLFVCRRVPFLF